MCRQQIETAEAEYNEYQNGNGFAPTSEPQQNQGHNMALVKDMIPSTYLKKEDFDEPTICTVAKVGKKNIAKDDETPDVKWLVKFDEFDKPMILNKSNIEALADACDSQDTDDWLGKEVIVYVDPNVMFAGERKGGLRIRKNIAAAQPKKALRAGPDIGEVAPF